MKLKTDQSIIRAIFPEIALITVIGMGSFFPMPIQILAILGWWGSCILVGCLLGRKTEFTMPEASSLPKREWAIPIGMVFALTALGAVHTAALYVAFNLGYLAILLSARYNRKKIAPVAE